jgi:uncharacterized membrane protein
MEIRLGEGMQMLDYCKKHSRGLAFTAAGVGAVGLTFALLSKLRKANTEADGLASSDAPVWTRKKSPKNSRRALSGKTVLINRPLEQLYDAWQVERFPEFMENVISVENMGDGVSRWVIKGPAGRDVTLINRISREDTPNRITWQSEPKSDIANSGEVRFVEAPANRGTYVSLLISYQPPAGGLGRAAAKILQREPEVQGRRDLLRFKQLMETGEITSNASPSGRSSESATEPHI